MTSDEEVTKGASLNDLCNDIACATRNANDSMACFQLRDGFDLEIPAWSIVVGKDVQIWGKIEIENRFNGYIKSLGYAYDSPDRNFAIANLFREVTGDSWQTLQLACAVFKSVIKQRNLKTTNLNQTVDTLELKMAHDSKGAKRLFIALVENAYENAIVCALSSFVDIRAPLVPLNVVNAKRVPWLLGITKSLW